MVPQTIALQRALSTTAFTLRRAYQPALSHWLAENNLVNATNDLPWPLLFYLRGQQPNPVHADHLFTRDPHTAHRRHAAHLRQLAHAELIATDSTELGYTLTPRGLTLAEAGITTACTALDQSLTVPTETLAPLNQALTEWLTAIDNESDIDPPPEPSQRINFLTERSWLPTSAGPITHLHATLVKLLAYQTDCTIQAGLVLTGQAAPWLTLAQLAKSQPTTQLALIATFEPTGWPASEIEAALQTLLSRHWLAQHPVHPDQYRLTLDGQAADSACRATATSHFLRPLLDTFTIPEIQQIRRHLATVSTLAGAPHHDP